MARNEAMYPHRREMLHMTFLLRFCTAATYEKPIWDVMYDVRGLEGVKNQDTGSLSTPLMHQRLV